MWSNKYFPNAYKFYLLQRPEYPPTGEVCLSLSHSHGSANNFKAFECWYFWLAEKYEREAKRYWDVFYKRHQDKVSIPNLRSLYLTRVKVFLIALCLLDYRLYPETEVVFALLSEIMVPGASSSLTEFLFICFISNMFDIYE